MVSRRKKHTFHSSQVFLLLKFLCDTRRTNEVDGGATHILFRRWVVSCLSRSAAVFSSARGRELPP